jgi:hypothetical protein
MIPRVVPAAVIQMARNRTSMAGGMRQRSHSGCGLPANRKLAIKATQAALAGKSQTVQRRSSFGMGWCGCLCNPGPAVTPWTSAGGMMQVSIVMPAPQRCQQVSAQR